MRALSLAFILLILLLAPLPQVAGQGAGDRIVATGDTALQQLRTKNTITGSGTLQSPYVIEGLEIIAGGGHGIELTNTRAHVVIRNVSIIGGGTSADGIRLVNATNVTIRDVDLQFNRNGIVLQQSNGTRVYGSTIRASSQAGVLLLGTGLANVSGNEISVNGRNIQFDSFGGRHSTHNQLWANNLSIASGQTGLFFSSISVYNNTIHDSNVVNFVPVRWHVNVRGTAAAPHVFTDEVVPVKGVTNVAQVMCFECNHVRFTNVNASNGVAGGLVLERSQNATIDRTFAEGNDGAGIQVRNGTRVRIEDVSTYGNRAGVHLLASSNVTLARSVFGANTIGAHVQTSNLSAVRDSSFEHNDDGIFLDNSTRLVLENNTYRASKSNGVRIVGGSLHLVRNETAIGGGNGIAIADAVATNLTASTFEQNARSGIQVSGSKTVATRITGNLLRQNGDAGIRFANANGPNFVEDNTLQAQPKHIRIGGSESNFLERNTMSAGPNETGLWFDDEKSYTNSIPSSNTVGGTPVQWHVALVGSPTSPIELGGILVDTPNMTNIAQVMLYKSSYIRLVDAHVSAGGPRGIYVLQSSSVSVLDAELEGSPIGLELKGTQTGEARRVRAQDARSGVLLTDTLNVSVADISAPQSNIVVEFTDAKSRGSVVERIDATGAKTASVRDPSLATQQPRHLIADAGLDKLVGRAQNLTFSDATGVARFGGERVVSQRWDLGDGTQHEADAAAPLRPTHAYAEAGNYTASYSIRTADGLELSDTVRVRVVGPPQPPVNLSVNVSQKAGKVALEWLPPESEFPITKYQVYRGFDPENLTLLLNATANATTVEEKFDKAMQVYYAITATAFGGESELSQLYQLNITPPPKPTPPPSEPTPEPTPEEQETPGAPLVALVAALGAVALARRRR